MRETDSTLQRFAEFLLTRRLVHERAAPFVVRWVRRFLSAPATDGTLSDQVRRFCENLERQMNVSDWQVRQAEQSARIYFVNFLGCTDWHRPTSSTSTGEHGAVDPLAARAQLRLRLLAIEVTGLSSTVRARRGERLPTVLSAPETASLLGSMHGTSRLMASLIYGGGLRVSECCELRIKDIDFDQGILFVRSGRGDKDRRTLLPECGRDELRAQLKTCRSINESDRHASVAGVWIRR